MVKEKGLCPICGGSERELYPRDNICAICLKDIGSKDDIEYDKFKILKYVESDYGGYFFYSEDWIRERGYRHFLFVNNIHKKSLEDIIELEEAVKLRSRELQNQLVAMEGFYNLLIDRKYQLQNE